MAKKSAEMNEGEAIIIKKYANRRLYNTHSSKYITLDFLAELTREKIDFVVVDAKTGEDITHNVLTQIIVEEEASGRQMLPVSFLRELISLYGDSMQSVVPQFLESSMATFRKNQSQFHSALEGAMSVSPFGQIAKRNLELMKAAQSALVAPTGADKPAAEAEEAGEEEIDLNDLKRQMAELQRKMERLTDNK